jgi:hypothetical protein
MFKSLQKIYSKFKKLINYISCKLIFNSEQPYYKELPDDEIKTVLF